MHVDLVDHPHKQEGVTFPKTPQSGIRSVKWLNPTLVMLVAIHRTHTNNKVGTATHKGEGIIRHATKHSIVCKASHLCKELTRLCRISSLANSKEQEEMSIKFFSSAWGGEREQILPTEPHSAPQKNNCDFCFKHQLCSLQWPHSVRYLI